MKTSFLALPIFVGGLALVAAPALAESDHAESTEIVITNFNQSSTAEDATDTDDVADTDDSDDQGDDNDDQGGDDGGNDDSGGDGGGGDN